MKNRSDWQILHIASDSKLLTYAKVCSGFVALQRTKFYQPLTIFFVQVVLIGKFCTNRRIENSSFWPTKCNGIRAAPLIAMNNSAIKDCLITSRLLSFNAIQRPTGATAIYCHSMSFNVILLFFSSKKYIIPKKSLSLQIGNSQWLMANG